MTDRPPTNDEQRGIDWWNGESETTRRFWWDVARRENPGKDTSVADAWAAFKQHTRKPHQADRAG
jgi:hypothetical protein